MNNHPRILIAVGDLLGCGYYRCLLPYKALANLGAEIEITNILFPDKTSKFDVLVLQRQHAEGVIKQAKLYKENVPHGKVVFEFDDNLHAIPNSNPSSKIYGGGKIATKNTEILLDLADMVTVSTPQLLREYTRFNKNINVCYNALDNNVFEKFELSEKNFDNEKIRIGWAGSSTHTDDFKKVVPALIDIFTTNKNVEFVFMGSDMRGMFPFEIRQRMSFAGDTFPRDKNGHGTNYSQDNENPTVKYYKVLQSLDLDIALAPLESFVFNACKSYIKLIEYGLAGIPFVASRFGPYLQYVNESTNKVGLLAESKNDWKKSIQLLIDNKELRKELRKNNFDYVGNNHLLSHKIKNWVSAYNTLDISFDGIPGTYTENIDKGQQVA